MDDRDTYTIHIDGRWSLEDLYIFPRAYEQVYFCVEAFLPTIDVRVNERIVSAFKAFPWQGGYSAVGFYNQLKSATPDQRRPIIASMSYASPGWIELGVILSLAYAVSKVINIVTKTIDNCNRTYSQIYADAQHRELLRIDIERKKLQLTKSELNFILENSDKLVDMMELPSARDDSLAD